MESKLLQDLTSIELRKTYTLYIIENITSGLKTQDNSYIYIYSESKELLIREPKEFRYIFKIMIVKKLMYNWNRILVENNKIVQHKIIFTINCKVKRIFC